MKKSFTLIELLVVIAIIGGLSAMLLPNFMGARERARDTQRKSDIKAIQKALELYKSDKLDASYPTTGSLPAVGSSFSNGATIYMSKFPGPPNDVGSSTYIYARDAVSTRKYNLCACLENKADPDKSTDCSTCTGCTSGPCYLVNEP